MTVDVATLPCRSCGETGLTSVLDLGETPLADALVPPERLGDPEDRFSLEIAFCRECTLVQVLEEVPPEKLFVENYLYFSSFSNYLLEHARRHAEELIVAGGLDETSLVVELASNDGYLLRNFVDDAIPVLGIDPAPDQAEAAIAAGIPTIAEFFGTEMARGLRKDGVVADVIIANNVLAHVPDLNGFVEGMATLLADDGIVTIENPYVRELIDRCAFDTIYHEHFCYFSCTAIDYLMRRHGLFLNHVEYFPDLHGGTLRWYVSKRNSRTETAVGYLEAEVDAGLDQIGYYEAFGARVRSLQSDLGELLESLRVRGATIAAYGAAAKGATMLNTTRIGTDLVEFVVDRNVHKHGTFMPGTHQQVRDPAALLTEQPDYVLLLAWNFADEIVAQQSEYLERGGRFIVPVPTLKIIGD